MRKRVFLLTMFFFTALYAAPKEEYLDYYQIIVNDTDFTAKISLLNEETHFYENYEIEPNGIVKLPERLYTENLKSKRLVVQNPYLYIASYKYVTPHECVYLLKSTRKNVELNTKKTTGDFLDFEEDEEEFFVPTEEDEEYFVTAEDEEVVSVEEAVDEAVEEAVDENLVLNEFEELYIDDNILD